MIMEMIALGVIVDGKKWMVSDMGMYDYDELHECDKPASSSVRGKSVSNIQNRIGDFDSLYIGCDGYWYMHCTVTDTVFRVKPEIVRGE